MANKIRRSAMLACSYNCLTQAHKKWSNSFWM